MRKIILNLHMSLDNVVSDLEQWMTMNDELLNESMEYHNTIDTIIFGGRTYGPMGEYWQGAETTSGSQLERAFAKKINDIHKLMVSRSSHDLTWRQSKLLKFEDITGLRSSLQELKNQTGKNISVASGIGLWQLFLANDLYDELRLYVQPAIAGKGERLFDGTALTKLQLKNTKTFDCGVVKLHYERKV